MIVDFNQDNNDIDEDQESEFDIYGQEEDKKIFFQISIFDPDIRYYVNWSPMTMNIIEIKHVDK